MVKVHSMAPIISAPLKLLLFLFQTVFCRCFLAHPLIMLRRLLTLWGIFGRHFADNILWTSSLFTSFFPLVLCIPHITSRSFLFPLSSWIWAKIMQGLVGSSTSSDFNRLQVHGVEWMSKPRVIPCRVYLTISEVGGEDECLAPWLSFYFLWCFLRWITLIIIMFLLVVLNDE